MQFISEIWFEEKKKAKKFRVLMRGEDKGRVLAQSKKVTAATCTRFHVVGSDFTPRQSMPSFLPESVNWS